MMQLQVALMQGAMDPAHRGHGYSPRLKDQTDQLEAGQARSFPRLCQINDTIGDPRC